MSKIKRQVLEPLLENSNYNVDLYHIAKWEVKMAKEQYEQQQKLRKTKTNAK